MKNLNRVGLKSSNYILFEHHYCEKLTGPTQAWNQGPWNQRASNAWKQGKNKKIDTFSKFILFLQKLYFNFIILVKLSKKI